MKIAIVGSDTAAKSAVIIALSKEIDLLDLSLQQISVASTTEIKLLIYIPDLMISEKHPIDQLRETYQSIIFISQSSDPLLRDSDLFVPIAPFNSFNTELVLRELFSIRKFIYSLNPSVPPLTDIQLQVLDKYYMGLSKEEASAELKISPRTYQNILTDLRMLFGVLKNRELIHLISIPTLLTG
jgi:DNA-binding CsgD family transcriptional regulator